MIKPNQVTKVERALNYTERVTFTCDICGYRAEIKLDQLIDIDNVESGTEGLKCPNCNNILR